MPQKTEYINLEDLPKTKHGFKPIPQEWITTITNIPIGKALPITDMKMGTVQGRLKNLKKQKLLAEEYKVVTRKQDGKLKVYVAHNPKEK